MCLIISSSHTTDDDDINESSLVALMLNLCGSLPFVSCDEPLFGLVRATALVSTWTSLINAGKLKASTILKARRFPLMESAYNTSCSSAALKSVLSPKTILKAAKSIPDIVSASEVVEWVLVDVLPMLRWLQPLVSDGGSHNTYSLLASGLCERARIAVTLHNDPFDALVAAEMAVKVVQRFACSTEFSASQLPVVGASRRLLANLKLQISMWRHFDSRSRARPSYAEVDEIGLEGLIWDRLWTVEDSETAINDCVLRQARPVVEEANSNLDQVLVEWVRETILSRSIVDVDVGSELSEHVRNDSEKCSLSRLVHVTRFVVVST